MNSRFRLKKSSDFKRVRQYGKSYAHPYVILIVQKNDLDHNKVGVAAGKSLGNAVARNRAKRVIRAAITPLLPKIKTGYDLLLIARHKLLSKKAHQVQLALKEKLEQAKIFKPND